MSTVVKVSKISGRGVFATKDIRKGEKFLVNPLLITKKKDTNSLFQTDLSNYWYEWGKNTFAIAMGHGSFFNHSSSANAEYDFNESKKEIFFTAVKSIRKGEEIFINYNGEASCKDKVWFEK
jgi:SET domain-containing protein